MREYLTALLQCTVSMSVITLAYMTVLPLLSKRYTAKWRYAIWLVIVAGWIFPFRPIIGLPFHPIEILEIIQAPIQPTIDVIPATANTGYAASGEASAILWRVAMIVWFTGFIVVAARHIWRQKRFMNIVHRWSNPITDPETLEIWERLKTEMNIRTPIGLNVCASATGPMLTGVFHPVVLLPPVKMAEEELTLALRHELIHFKHHDLWHKAVVLTATAIHWFNPVVYLMAQAAATQCEIFCDEHVLKGVDLRGRKRYAETILSCARAESKLQTALSSNFYESAAAMKTRITSILDATKKKAGLGILCAVLVGIAGTGTVFAEAYPGKLDTAGDNRLQISETDGIPFSTFVSIDAVSGDGVCMALTNEAKLTPDQWPETFQTLKCGETTNPSGLSGPFFVDSASGIIISFKLSDNMKLTKETWQVLLANTFSPEQGVSGLSGPIFVDGASGNIYSVRLSGEAESSPKAWLEVQKQIEKRELDTGKQN